MTKTEWGVLGIVEEVYILKILRGLGYRVKRFEFQSSFVIENYGNLKSKPKMGFRVGQIVGQMECTIVVANDIGQTSAILRIALIG